MFFSIVFIALNFFFSNLHRDLIITEQKMLLISTLIHNIKCLAVRINDILFILFSNYSHLLKKKNVRKFLISNLNEI